MDDCKNAQRKTLMAALDNLLIQRENISDLSRRSDTLREKMHRTEDRPHEAITSEALAKKSGDPDIVDLFNDAASEIRVSIEKVRQNINAVIEMID